MKNRRYNLKKKALLVATHLQCPVGDDDADEDLEGIV